MTIRDVLTAMHYTFPHIVVAVNGTVVRHDAYDTTTIPDDADVRVIHLMAGG
jgi:sulfur carrier protein